MSLRKHFKFVGIVIAIVALTVVSQAQTAGDSKIANMTVGGTSVRWDVLAPNSGGSVLVSFPDGRSFKKGFRAGAAPEIDLGDKQLEGLPEGVYTYELRLAPALTGAEKQAMMKARGNDDEPEAERAARKRPAVAQLVQHGSFAVINGALVGPGAIEGERSASNTAPQKIKQAATVTPLRVSANTITRLRNHRFSLGMMPDDVIADDLIVQGSACVGLDCVSGEVFGFDTVRLKENNTRLQFEDTSAAGFPLNNWQIRANSSAAGGASFLAFVDQGASGNSETGTIVFEVDAGAPANSVKVASNGKVGFRTATPVLDLHMNTSDTPAMRMEQNNSGGFTAQTWDVAGNEANFFVRDVTGGSRLPFRIRPGAPTSSVDIAASGNVGVGTASPSQKLQVIGGQFGVFNSATTGGASIDGNASAGTTAIYSDFLGGNEPKLHLATFSGRATAAGITILTSGSVGVGTTAPDQLFSVNGEASKIGGGSWQSFSDERLKNIKGSFTSGLNAVMRLQPLRYEYKRDNVLGLKSEGEHIGFAAQALQKVIPEAVSTTRDGFLMVNNDPILWTMLNAIKEQQAEIAQLKQEVQRLKGKSHRRNVKR